MEVRRVVTPPGCDVEVYEGGAGPELVYLHGVTGLLPQDPFLASLSEHFHVYAPVMPGYGTSTGQDTIDSVFAFAMHGYDVIDALGLNRPVLAGHCMGGMVAAEMAALAPNDVSHLALIGALGLWVEETPVPDLFATLPYQLPELLFNDAQRGHELLGSGRDFNDAEFLTDFLVGNANRMGMAGKLLFPVPDRGLARRLYRVKVSTTLLWGTADALTPEPYLRAFEALIPHAKSYTVEGGHMVHYEQTVKIVEALAVATGK